MWVQSLGQEDPLRRKCQSTQVFMPGESMDRGAWQATYSPQSCKESAWGIHGQRSLAGYIQSIELQRVRHDLSNLAGTRAETVAHQALLSMGLPRPKYCSGLPFPTPGDPLNLGIKPMPLVSPALAGKSLPLSHLGSPQRHIVQAVLFNHYLYLCEYIFITPKENSILVKQSLTFFPSLQFSSVQQLSRVQLFVTP